MVLRARKKHSGPIMSLSKLLEILASWAQSFVERLAVGIDPDDIIWPPLRDYPYRDH
jgi:hypothetical protein